MAQRIGAPRSLCCHVLLAAGLLAGGCQTSGGVLERLDPDSGLTVVSDPAPAAFARTEGRLSRSARDYVYLGPVEINERGTREYYLWVGIASTIDRNYLGSSKALPSFLYMNVGDTPIELRLGSWREREPRVDGQRIYVPAVAPSAVLAARVTLDQLALLQRSAPGRLRLAAEDGTSVEYVAWKNDSLWPEFIDYAGLDTGH